MDKLRLWIEVYNGLPGKRGVKCLQHGWGLFPPTDTIFEARDKAKRILGGGKRVVLCYEEERCARKFRASDSIVGIFA